MLSSSEPSYFQRNFNFLADYFLHSQSTWKARWLFLGCVLGVLATSGLGFVFGGWCFPYILAAFIAKDVVLLAIGLSSGLLIAGAVAGINYFVNYLKNTLYVDWRSWLTKKIINQYINNKTNYLEISRVYKHIDNPEQRIQEDIDKIVESSLDLSLGFVDNSTNLILYMVLLGLAGSSLSLLFGPVYLIGSALLVGVVTSLMGYFIARKLNGLTNDEIVSQSNVRVSLQQLKNSSEEIAIEHAEKYYQERLASEVDELKTKTTKRLSVQNNTKSFNVFNGIFQAIVPFMISTPLYFTNLISQNVFYSVGYYFSMVTRSLNWFVESFDLINKFRTSLNRIDELQTILNKKQGSESTHKIIYNLKNDNENLEVKNLTLTLHNNNAFVIKGLNLKFTPGVHTLIQAPSGTGKSSLFKAIARTWLTGEGEITIPQSHQSIYFLPQKPTLPDDSLRKILAYPDSSCPYSDEELMFALKAVNMDLLTDKLDEKIGFKSLGEQQRIAFARVILRKPDWVFLDEATASLDEPLEKQTYERIKALLPKTTIISIAHCSTVKRHHDNVVFFKPNENKEIQIEEEKILAEDKGLNFICI